MRGCGANPEAAREPHRVPTQENDDALAVRHFEGIAGQLRQIFAAHAVDQLALQIDRYDFDDARETLAQLILQRQHAD